ncbi:MAG: hypothetical protein K8T20_03275 [Planctomycetes bacterium]|nr:hypothetical protein [Planctomycetota bacterium]
MSRLRQLFFVSPLVLQDGHFRPVVDLYDGAWSWLADIGDRRLVQVFAKPQTVSKLTRDRRLVPVESATFALLQELTHREGGAELLREALSRSPVLPVAAREALAVAPPRVEPEWKKREEKKPEAP